jgi:hypothetical protein
VTLGVEDDHVPLQLSLVFSDKRHDEDGRGEEYAESCTEEASEGLLRTKPE